MASEPDDEPPPGDEQPGQAEGWWPAEPFWRWFSWAATAVIVEVVIGLQYLGEDIDRHYGLGQMLVTLVWQLGIVGGMLFRAGYLYAQTRQGPTEN